MKGFRVSILCLILFGGGTASAKDVAFVGSASIGAKWVYFGGPSIGAEWIYLGGPSIAAEWIYLSGPSNADYTICFPSGFQYTKKHFAAIYVLYLKRR